MKREFNMAKIVELSRSDTEDQGSEDVRPELNISEQVREKAMEKSRHYFETQARAAKDYLEFRQDYLKRFLIADTSLLTDSIFQDGSEMLSPGTKKAILRSLNLAREELVKGQIVGIEQVEDSVSKILEPEENSQKARVAFDLRQGYYFETDEGRRLLERIQTDSADEGSTEKQV